MQRQMHTISRQELEKVFYLKPEAVYGRTLLLMPFWDGFNWHQWVEAPPGSFIKIQVVETVHSNYVANYRANESDLWIQFIDIMWQRASYPEIADAVRGIQDDFHLLGTCADKLRHYFETREQIALDIRASYVRTELEYLLTVTRSTFDLLQEAIAYLWNNTTRLLDPELEAKRQTRKLPDSFTKMVLKDRHIVRPPDELMETYTLPPLLAECYSHYAAFFAALMQARDRVAHRGGSVETIFETKKGFCVDPKAKTFSSFQWQPKHYYNENIVSLLPWIAYVIFGTIEACNQIMLAFARTIMLPEEIAPGYRVFIRDPANRAIIRLGSVAEGKIVWWSDTTPEGRQKAGSPPSTPQPESNSTPKDA